MDKKNLRITVILLCIGIFFVSILVISLFLSVLPEKYRINENSDYISFYEPVAQNILAGKGIVDKESRFMPRYPPGYPILLSGVFALSNLLHISEQKAVNFFILFCSGISSIFIFLIARIIWGNWGGIISSLIWMTYPPFLWLTKQPNSEIPFLVFFLGSLCLFFYALIHRNNNKLIYFFIGLLMGITMLIRPIAIGISLIIGVIFWLMRRDLRFPTRLSLIMILLLGNLLVVLPWEAKVFLKTGKIIPLSTGGVPTVRDGLTFSVQSKGYRQHINIPQDIKSLMKDVSQNYDKLDSLRSIISFIKKEFKKRPLTVLKLFAIKAARSWYGTDSLRYEVIILPVQLTYLIIIFSGFYYTWKKKKDFRKLLVSVWIIVIYFWLMTTLALSILRYMVPVIGLCFILIPAIFAKNTRNDCKFTIE